MTYVALAAGHSSYPCRQWQWFLRSSQWQLDMCSSRSAGVRTPPTRYSWPTRLKPRWCVQQISPTPPEPIRLLIHHGPPEEDVRLKMYKCSTNGVQMRKPNCVVSSDPIQIVQPVCRPDTHVFPYTSVMQYIARRIQSVTHQGGGTVHKVLVR